MLSSTDSSNEKVLFISSPQSGECVPITEIPDEVFSEKILGDGVAIIPSENEVVSPVDGEIIQIAETNHAFCIRSSDGLDLMIHIGVDTVKLNGQGFKSLVKNGDTVRKGDPIAVADIEFIKKNNFPVHTAMLITNLYEVGSLKQNYGKVEIGKSVIIEYTKK